VCVSLSLSLSGERRRALDLPEIAIPRFYPKRAIASLQPRKKAHNENNSTPLKPCQRSSSQETEVFFFCWFLFIIIIFFLSFLYVKSFMMGAAAGVWGSVIMTMMMIFFFFTKKGRNLF
jgi:hypothetical protein